MRVGDAVPDFGLRDQHGRTVRLSSLRGRAVAVMFYPWAFSNVCTGELQGVRDRLADFQDDSVQVLAVSCDPVYSLRAYADRDGLAFPLLSDFWPHGAVASAYGVLDEERGCPRRSSFVIDGDGLLRWSVHHETSRARDLDEHLRELRAASRDAGGPAPG